MDNSTTSVSANRFLFACPAIEENNSNEVFKILTESAPELARFIPLLKNCSPEDVENIVDENNTIDQYLIGEAITNKYDIMSLSPYGESLKPWGCDPQYSKFESKLPRYAGETLLVMGCSGLRLLSIACHLQLSADKVFIMSVDNSYYIHALWQSVCNFMRAHSAEDFKNFPINLPRNFDDLDPQSAFLSAVQPDFDANQRLNMASLTYLCGLVHFYGYDRVNELVSTALILPCDWQSPGLVSLVRENNAFKQAYPADIKLICYLSNIVSYSCAVATPADKRTGDDSIQFKAAYDVLRNVEKLDPDLAIHVDFKEEQNVVGSSNESHTCQDVHFVTKGNHDKIDEIIKIVWPEAETVLPAENTFSR